MSADVFENGTHVQAGATPDAVQGVPLLGIGEQARPVIIEQDHVELLRSVDLARLPRSAEHRVVTGEVLAGASSGEHREQKRQIGELRHHLFDADHGHMHLGQSRREPRVPLVLRDRDHPGLGDDEIGAGDPHIASM
jgi:hypothetical protein